MPSTIENLNLSAPTPTGPVTHVIRGGRTIMQPSEVDKLNRKNVAIAECDLQQRRAELRDAGKAMSSPAEGAANLVVLKTRLADQVRVIAKHAAKIAAAMVPVERLGHARQDAADALARAESELVSFDAAERAAVEAWGETGKGDKPVPHDEERHSLERRFADARRHLDNVAGALERQKNALVPLREAERILHLQRDALVIEILYEEAERVGFLYRAAIAEAARCLGDLDGLNQALADFRDIPHEYVPPRPVVGAKNPPAIKPRDLDVLQERRVDATGYWLKAHHFSDFTAIATIDDIRGAWRRWSSYIRALRSADDPVAVDELKPPE